MLEQAEFEAELYLAVSSRMNGNEGRARVCARRAAGMVARAYLEQRGIEVQSRSAYEQLKRLSTLEDISPELQEIIRHFLLKVDEAYRLPENVDLIKEARWLYQTLSSGTKLTSRK